MTQSAPHYLMRVVLGMSIATCSLVAVGSVLEVTTGKLDLPEFSYVRACPGNSALKIKAQSSRDMKMDMKTDASGRSRPTCGQDGASLTLKFANEDGKLQSATLGFCQNGEPLTMYRLDKSKIHDVALTPGIGGSTVSVVISELGFVGRQAVTLAGAFKHIELGKDCSKTSGTRSTGDSAGIDYFCQVQPSICIETTTPHCASGNGGKGKCPEHCKLIGSGSGLRSYNCE